MPGLLVLATLQACGPGGDDDGTQSRIVFERVAAVRSQELDEISGLETIPGPRLVVHNDEGEPDLFVLDGVGEVVARYRLTAAENRDWEDISQVDHDGERLLAVGDIGDNLGRRRSIRIYFVELPDSDPRGSDEPERIAPRHVLDLTYPDGPRDCEAMAFDPSSGRILLLTKRDKPPRLYGVDAGKALTEARLELEFLGVAAPLRPPTRDDFRHLGKEGAWISQPTGMDINDDGTLAAVITYRSLYFFERAPQQTWAQALQGTPREFLGPPAWGEEAVAFDSDMRALFISSEGHPAPIYYAELPPERE